MSIIIVPASQTGEEVKYKLYLSKTLDYSESFKCCQDSLFYHRVFYEGEKYQMYLILEPIYGTIEPDNIAVRIMERDESLNEYATELDRFEGPLLTSGVIKYFQWVLDTDVLGKGWFGVYIDLQIGEEMYLFRDFMWIKDRDNYNV